ncbi:peptidylprolyl isomerase [Pedobacter duraquae]|uniref:PpiC domain-containing protein n=1 Tax=Pedobacter duraquae TaxID=425511 RepID=A0A4R6IEV6_9SPHI|nr:hypothetical protein [Pedobacter duraquae]TDO20241.1 hypothetical protein CLV32_4001 [Pedobacter duraquae]
MIRKLLIIITLFTLYGVLYLKINLKSDDIVIEVGDYKITKYELDVRFKRYYDEYYSKNNCPPLNIEYKKWFARLINNSYILADAHKNNLYEDSTTKQAITYLERRMVNQSFGLYYEKKIASKIPIDEKEIENLYLERKYKYNIDLLVLPDRRSLKALDFDYIKENGFDSNLIKRSVPNSMVMNNAILCFPNSFFSEVERDVRNLKIGTISSPHSTKKGVFIIKLLNIDSAKDLSLKESRQFLKYILRKEEITKAITIDENRILNVANIVFHEGGLSVVLKKIKSKSLPLPQVRLAEYFENGHRKYFFSNQLFTYQKYLPLKPNIHTIGDLKKQISNLIVEDNKYKEAIRNGYLDRRFLTSKKIFSDNLIFKTYLENLIKDKTRKQIEHRNPNIDTSAILTRTIANLKLKYKLKLTLQPDIYYQDQNKSSIAPEEQGHREIFNSN